jgi:hypothetical protein
MDHAAEIIELRKTVDRLDKEIERLNKEKFPYGTGVRRYLFSLLSGVALMGGLFYAMAYVGLPSSSPRGYHTLSAENLSLYDRSDVSGIGSIRVDRPEITLSDGKDRLVSITPDGLQLRGEHGAFEVDLRGDSAHWY